jgi:hypothetical protein
MDTVTNRTRANGGRALVVANEGVAGRELRERLLEQLGDRVGEVFVVAPAMTDSGLKYALGDVDGAIAPAEERLRSTLEELHEAGIEAAGEVGDSDPLLAIQDEMLKFHPDQIVLVGHRDEDGAFAEKGLLDQAERDLDMPVTELVVDRDAEPHVLDVKRTEAGAGRDEGWQPSGNWPPLTRNNVAGMLVAIVGTLLLGALAANAVGAANGPDLEEGRLGDTAAAASVLIATAMALINLAHVVGLLLFQSNGYEGMWSRFFARLSMVGTTTAIVVVVLITLVL